MLKKNFNCSGLMGALFLMFLLPQGAWAKSYYSVFRLTSPERKTPQELEVVREEKNQGTQTLLKITVQKKEGFEEFHFPNPWEILWNHSEGPVNAQWPYVGFGGVLSESEAWSLPIPGLPTLPLTLKVTLSDKKIHYQVSGDVVQQMIPLSGDEVEINVMLKEKGLQNMKVTGTGEAVLDADGNLRTQKLELEFEGDKKHWHVEWAEGRIE